VLELVDVHRMDSAIRSPSRVALGVGGYYDLTKQRNYGSELELLHPESTSIPPCPGEDPEPLPNAAAATKMLRNCSGLQRYAAH
jgi:hypothetical protein